MRTYRQIPEWNSLDFVRFWSKVIILSPNECWIWKASTSHGYGSFQLGDHDHPCAIAAHRISWAMAHRVLDIPLHVCHKCDNPPCVNPNHLFLGDDAANVADSIAKGRQCKGQEMTAALIGNMPRGRTHHNVKLTEEQVRLIRRLYSEGESTHVSLSRQFKVKPTTIQAILERRIWAWLT